MFKYSIMRFFLIFALGLNSIVFASEEALAEGLDTPRLAAAIQALYVEANSPDKISKELKGSIAKTLYKYDGKKTNSRINEIVAEKTGIGLHVVRFCRRQESSESRNAARAASVSQDSDIFNAEDDEAELPTFIPTTFSNFPPAFPQFFKAIYDFSFVKSPGSKKLSENQTGAKLITLDNLPTLQKQMKLTYVDSQFATTTKSRPDMLFIANNINVISLWN